MSHPDFNSIETERLILRKLHEADVDDLFQMTSDPEVVNQTAVLEVHTHISQTIQLLQSMLSGYNAYAGQDWSVVAIVEKQSNKMIGYVGFFDQKPSFLRAELGYIIHRAYWNKGYATEACRALLDFGFKRIGLNRIEATAFPENIASTRVLEKVGMQYEGLMRQRVMRDGVARDRVMYAVLKDEYAKLP